jgi:hypothetical protein
MADTTKAKHPKRRKDDPKPWVKAPKGAYTSGIYDQYTLMRLGAICGIWTHIEEVMIVFFSFLLGDKGGAGKARSSPCRLAFGSQRPLTTRLP